MCIYLHFIDTPAAHAAKEAQADLSLSLPLVAIFRLLATLALNLAFGIHLSTSMTSDHSRNIQRDFDVIVITENGLALFNSFLFRKSVFFLSRTRVITLRDGNSKV